MAPILLLLLGCAPMVSRTSGALVTGGLAALGEADNQERLRALLDDPAVAAAAARLAAAALDGSLDALSEPERAMVMQARAAELVDALSPRLAQALQADLGPALRAELTLAVRDAALALTRDPARADLVAFARAVSAAVADTLGPRLWASAGDGLTRHVGPAAAESLRASLGPALAEVLEAQLAPVASRTVPPLVAETARLATREMLREVELALEGGLGEALRADRDATLGAVDALIQAREEAARGWLRAVGLLAALLGLSTGGLGLLWWRSRREAGLGRSAVELVAGVIKERAGQDPAALELARAVRDTGADTAAGDWLSKLLDEKRHLKISVGRGDPPPADPAP